MSDEFMKIKELLEKKTGRKAVIKKMVKNNGTSYTGIFVEFESTNTLPVIKDAATNVFLEHRQMLHRFCGSMEHLPV